ncbi:MAG: ATP-dependent zinc metalloprotease FtsH [Clostridia bacterium]|nr:ATP-dependent zinc metalloprotease FtsH [Clostridia bacterium]
MILLVIAISTMRQPSNIENVSQPYSELRELFNDEQVSEFVVDGLTLTVTTQDGRELIFRLRSADMFVEDFQETYNRQYDEGIIKSFDFPQEFQPSWWMSMIPYAVFMVIIIVFWFFMMNQSQGGGGKVMSFGKSKAKLAVDNKKKVTFNDVAGADEEKEELKEVVDFLKDSHKFTELGARIPKGVLLVGPPGTGKTLIAKAVSGEAGVPFFSISGSDFVEMFVGVGASRVRDLFEQAKKNSPCIIFIDEIDAVGRHRGAGLGGGHDEREQTLNQLLVEMDGFGANEGVIVIAATNRADILDPALLRPGRFDRQIYVGYPDVKGREAILHVHARGKPFDKDVNFEVVAKTTAGFTGADLANLLNEAALLSARKNKRSIGMEELEEAMIKVIAGPEKHSRVMTEKAKRLTAYHEAGHAIVTRHLTTTDPVHQISIIPRGRAGGYTLSLPKEDKSYMSKKEIFESIVVLLGGRVAEQLVLDDISTGASNDIERATSSARSMVTTYGMSDRIGPINYGDTGGEVFLGRDFSTGKHISEKVTSEIDEEIRRIISDAYEKCTEILNTHMNELHIIAAALMAEEKLDGERFELLLTSDDPMSLIKKPEPKKKEPPRVIPVPPPSRRPARYPPAPGTKKVRAAQEEGEQYEDVTSFDEPEIGDEPKPEAKADAPAAPEAKPGDAASEAPEEK